METRAHHLLIGSFILAFIAGILAFSLWLAKAQIDREVARYNVFFTGSVAGLGLGGDVRFNGIKVGSVSQIAIDPVDSSKVRVTVEMASDTPVRKDSVASLELQGITGVSYVQVSPGTSGTERLPVVHGGDVNKYPTITSRGSRIAELMETAPELLYRSIDLVNRGSQLLSDENIGQISAMLTDIRAMTQALASRQDAFTRAIDNFAQTGADVQLAAQSARDLIVKFDAIASDAHRLLNNEATTTLREGQVAMAEARKLIAESRDAMKVLDGTLQTVNAMVEENRAPINAFATDGIGELRRFIGEARILVGSLARVAQRLEDDPSAVIFGNRDAEYRNPGTGGNRR